MQPASLRVALSKIMVLDSFERDFKVDLGNVLAPIDTRRGSLSAAAAPYNGFAPYLDGDQHLVYRHALSILLIQTSVDCAQVVTFTRRES